MTLIEDFRKELKILQSGIVKSHLPRQDRFMAISREGRILSFPKEIADSYLRAIRVLRLKSKNLGRLISDKELKSLFVSFLFDLKYGNEAKFMEKIDKNIVCLFDKLQSMRAQRHLFIIPIMSLSVAEDLFIGDTAIVNLTGQTLASLESKYSIKFRFSFQDLSQAADRMTKDNETAVYAIVTVDASDDEKALELAIQKADTCLNVLRLYNYGARFVVRDEYRRLVPRGIAYVNLDEKTYGEMESALNIVAHIPNIDSSVIDEMKKAGFDMINNILSKRADELTTLQKDTLAAIFWFGNAVKEEQRNMKFIKSIIALETLLIPDGGQGKGNRISKRYASLLYAQVSDDEKKEVFLNLRSLYDIRNSIIHSGEGYVYEDDLIQVMHWTQAAILFVLEYAEKFSSISELIEKEFHVDETLYADL